MILNHVKKSLFVAIGVLALQWPVAAQSPFEGETTTPGATRSQSQSNAATAVTPADEVAIGQAWVNVRKGPGTNNAVLATYPRGTKGTRLDEKNGWTLVKFANGTTGWVRSDLLGSSTSTALPSSGTQDKAALEKSFARWERHLGNDALDFEKVPSRWQLGKAWKAFQDGDFKSAFVLAQQDTSNPLMARYLMVKSLYNLGMYAEAKKMLGTIERALEDTVMLKIIDNTAQPWIDEKVPFKFGGFDSLAQFRYKRVKDARMGLNSGEYYEKYVDINTWKWRSDAAYQEYEKIAGIDCSGFIQRLGQDMFEDAKVSWPIPGRTSTSGLWSQKYTKEVNPGYRPPPPPDIRPGDLILLDYGHNRYGHTMMYRGVDAAGNIRVVMMGDTPVETILTPEKIESYKGTYRFNGMDKVRARLTA